MPTTTNDWGDVSVEAASTNEWGDVAIAEPPAPVAPERDLRAIKEVPAQAPTVLPTGDYDYLKPLPPITDAQLAGEPPKPSLINQGMAAFNRLFEPGPVKPSEMPMDASDRAKLEEAKNRVLLKERVGEVQEPIYTVPTGLRRSIATGTRALASPAGLVTAAAATVAPEVVLPTIFATTAAEVPEQIARVQKAREEGDRPGYYAAIGDLFQSAFILAGTGLGSFRPKTGPPVLREQMDSVNPPLVAKAIAEARKNGPSPEFRSFFGGIEPEIVGTTPEKVSAFAKSLGMEWKPVPKAGGEPEAPAVPAAPTPKGPAPAAPTVTTPSDPFAVLREKRERGEPVTVADINAALRGTAEPRPESTVAEAPGEVTKPESMTDLAGNPAEFYSLPRLRALERSGDPRIARAKQVYAAKTIPDLARLAKARFEEMAKPKPATAEEAEMARVQALPEGPEGEAQLVAGDIAKAVDTVNVDDIAGYSPVPALVRIIRRAPRDPAMKTAAEQAMQKIGAAAKEQGVPLDDIKTQIAGELKAVYGADAAEMAKYYFGETPAPEAAAFTPEELAEMDKEVAASKALVDREWPPVYKRIQDATGLAKRDLEKLGVYESVDHPSAVRNLARDITANAPGGKMNQLYDQLAAEGHTGRFLWGGTADAPTIGFDPDVPGARPDPVAAKKAWDAVNAVRGVFGHEPLPDFFGAKAAAATAQPTAVPATKPATAAKEPWQMTVEDAVDRAYPKNANVKGAPADAEATLNGMPATKKGGAWSYIATDATGKETRNRITDSRTAARLDHQVLVKEALDAGKPVPPEVLSDYPDLAKPAPEPPATAPPEPPTRPGPSPFFPRRSEAQGLGEQATAPTVEDVRRQRLLNREGTPVPPDPDTPTPPPTDPPLGVPEMNDETDIADNVRRQDVLPARDWWASPEYEFRKNPVAIDLVTKAVEAELHYQAEVGRDYERFDEFKRGLSKAQQINITKELRAAMEGDTSLLDGLPTHEREVATGIREYFDRVRRVIIEGKQRDLIDSLPEARAAAVHDILEGMDEADAFRAHRLRAAGQRAVRDALAELEALENWGLEDYITNIERGSYKVLNPEGTIVAIAETRTAAKEKALKYARENPGTTHLTITDEFSSSAEFPTKLTRGQYFRMARRAANALGTDVAEIQRMLRAEGSPIVVVKPPSKFAGALLQRRNILKGEDNIFDALPGYSYSIRKKLALDPVFKEVRGNLDKLPENMKSQVEELMSDIRGRYHVVDKIVDYLVAARFGTKPFAYSRGVGQARQVAAWLKLGYRPVTALVNRLGGLQHTWVKTGTKYLIQGRTLRHSPGWDEIWARNRDYVGASAPAFLEGSSGEVPLKHPLGMFQRMEKYNRPESFAAFYKYAQGELGLSGEAAEAFARKATRFAQFTYTVGSLPRILRSPTGKLVGQFKPYLVKELEFIFSLRGWEIPRYFTAFLAMGGPRAVIYMLRSLPILGALGILWMMEDWLNRKVPRASRGLPGYAGIDITASVTPQLPSTATDWAGPTLGDIYKLYDTVIRPAFEGETGRLHDFGTWASRLAPAIMYWSRMVEAITKKNGWMTDDRGRPQYKPGVGGKVAMAAGAKPLDQSVAEVNRAYMDHVNDITKKNREHLVDQILVALNKHDGATMNKLLKQAAEYGIDTNAIKEAFKQQIRTPDERLRRRLLKSVRVEEAERLDNPPKP